jgi:hypothetical protein
MCVFAHALQLRDAFLIVAATTLRWPVAQRLLLPPWAHPRPPSVQLQRPGNAPCPHSGLVIRTDLAGNVLTPLYLGNEVKRGVTKFLT